MLKAIAIQEDGRKVVILGIDARNVRRMKEGDPIHVKGEELGLTEIKSIVIAYGETMDALVGEMRAHGMPIPTAAEMRRMEAE